jgi:polar amino acid transport system permease protein
MSGNQVAVVDETALVAIPRRHYGPWIGGAVVTLIAAIFVQSLIVNPNFEWDVVATYFFSPQILRGILGTLGLTAGAMVIGIVLGTILAVMRRSPNWMLSRSAGLYIWFFRGTPLLVQLIFWYNLATLYPRLALGIPFTSVIFTSVDTNSVISPITAALLGLGLNQAAYTAEIVRSGILSVPDGQLDSASSLGMTRWMTMRRVILPQAMRVIIPPLGNETIGMLKTSSLVSVLAMPELLYSAQLIYNRTYQTIPMLIVASLWYLVVTTVLTMIQIPLERHYSKGIGRRPSIPDRWHSAFWRRAVRFHDELTRPAVLSAERPVHRS